MKQNWTLINAVGIFVISLTYIILTLPFYKDMVYIDDDLLTAYVFGSSSCHENIPLFQFFSCWRYADNGSFSVISWYALWAYYLPTWFHIHPNDFWPLRAVVLIHFLFLAYSFSLWLTLFLKPDERKKYRIVAFLCGLGIVLFFFTSMKTSIFYDHLFFRSTWTRANGIDPEQNYLVNRFFRYFPTYVALSFFLFFIARFFFYQIHYKKWSWKIVFIFLAIFLGLSGEYSIIITSAFSACLIFYYSYSVFIKKKSMKRIPLYFYFTVFIFIFSALLYASSPGFLGQTNRASLSFITLWKFMPTYVTGLFIHFLGLFLSFKWEYVFFLLFFTLTAIFIKNKTYQNLLRKTLFFAFFIHGAQIFIAFVTFFMPFGYNGVTFEAWIGHPTIASLNYCLILIELCLFASLTLRGCHLIIKETHSQENSLKQFSKKHVVNTLFFSLMFIYTWRVFDFGGVMYYKNYFSPGFVRYYLLLRQNQKELVHSLRLKTYQMDKLTRFFTLHHENIYWFKELGGGTSIAYTIGINKEREKEHFMGAWPNFHYPKYLSSFYGKEVGDAMEKGFILESKEQVMKRFHDLDGVFTEQELKELRFTNLQDDNFVLGKIKEVD